MVEWIEAFRRHEAKRTAGDPGPVPPRRLSNAEYDYTVRDLTGVDIRPTREFPVDPANEAGFDNSAESLTMSPALVKKYLEAARRVADHLVLTPDGFAFAPHPVVADTDRDKYVVRRVIDFYQRQPTDYADYFLAAWRFQHRAALGRPNATLADVAAEVEGQPQVPRDGLGHPDRRTGGGRPDRRAPGAVAGPADAGRGDAGRRPGRLRADARLRRPAPQATRAGGQEPDRAAGFRTARSPSCCGRTASSPRTGRGTPAARCGSGRTG